jgi:short-subunit dehydrogenase|tara:strand:+ start:62 stop:607 length:546 start_codon:yes stop_codon:yes gene_type:complete
MILILGKSTIAQALTDTLPDCTIVGRPEYDFSSRYECHRLVKDFTPDVVINTYAMSPNLDDAWEHLTVNFISVVYITELFYNKLENAHIINFSSARTYWSSYPGITTGNFYYNLSKTALSEFGKLYNRKIADNVRNTVTTFEVGKFNSKMNNFSGGMTIERVVDTVKDCIKQQYTQIALLR